MVRRRLSEATMRQGGGGATRPGQAVQLAPGVRDAAAKQGIGEPPPPSAPRPVTGGGPGCSPAAAVAQQFSGGRGLERGQGDVRDRRRRPERTLVPASKRVPLSPQQGWLGDDRHVL
jgi:hypothetical protein